MSARDQRAIDILLINIFPLVPFLSSLVLNNTIRMSGYALHALASKEGIPFLRVLRGIKWDGTPAAAFYAGKVDPMFSLLQACEGLEELELFGPGVQDDDTEFLSPFGLHTPPSTPMPPLHFPKLTFLSVTSLPKAVFLESLVRSALPSLRTLIVTPYEDVPSALTSALVLAHGDKLHNLFFHTPKNWPPERYNTPHDILRTATNLQHLFLTPPLPSLIAPSSPHPLRILSIPRPNAAYLRSLEAWLGCGLLPRLKDVHVQHVKWIRSGLSSRAAEAGVQGEMKEWQRRLGKWKVRVVDTNWLEEELVVR